jgi:hypothetical protein
MAHKSGVCIVWLLITAILLLPVVNSSESPQTVCGDSVSSSGDNENSVPTVIAAVVILIIVIFIIYCIAGTGNQSHRR